MPERKQNDQFICHLLFCYLGPINRMPVLDYIGATGESQPIYFMLAALALVIVAVLCHARQLKIG